jgi:hypothetical protein
LLMRGPAGWLPGGARGRARLLVERLLLAVIRGGASPPVTAAFVLNIPGPACSVCPSSGAVAGVCRGLP